MVPQKQFFILTQVWISIFPTYFPIPEKKTCLFKFLSFSWGLSVPCGFEGVQIHIHSMVVWKVTFLFDQLFLIYYCPSAVQCNTNNICQKRENRSYLSVIRYIDLLQLPVQCALKYKPNMDIKYTPTYIFLFSSMWPCWIDWMWGKKEAFFSFLTCSFHKGPPAEQREDLRSCGHSDGVAGAWSAQRTIAHIRSHHKTLACCRGDLPSPKEIIASDI